jgi:2-desacetyl-2-hydroxyethyl bacteriochlorophyllide A dehydrogenase
VPGTHREVVLAGPHDLGVQEVETRDPVPGHLLIAPEAVGVCGTDMDLLEGTMGYLTSGQTSYPLTPGHEWSGTVLAVGDGVEGFAPGDRIVGEAPIGCGVCALCVAGEYHLCPDRVETGFIRQPGALTERFVYPARGAHLLPSNVSMQDAALIEPTAVAYRGVRRLMSHGGDRLLIIGGGTIGLLCALTAHALGLEDVLVVELQPDRRRFAEGLGLKTAVSADGSWTLVIEASGREPGMQASLDATGVGGRLLLIGLCGRPSIPVDIDRIVLKDQTVMGNLSSPGVWPEVIDLVATGRLQPGRLVTHRYPLDETAAAFRQMEARDPGTVKIHIHPQGYSRIPT